MLQPPAGCCTETQGGRMVQGGGGGRGTVSMLFSGNRICRSCVSHGGKKATPGVPGSQTPVL